MSKNNLELGAMDAELLEVRTELESSKSDEDLLRLVQGIGKEEFSLIGELIQIYCVADALCRGLVAMFREHRLGTASDFAYGLNDTDVLAHTKAEAAKTSLHIDRAGVVLAVKTLEMHRVFRHTFSHWTVTRHVEGRHLVAFTKSSTDAERRDGITLNGGIAKFMVFRIDDLLAELEKVKGHCKFLGDLHRDMGAGL